MAATVKSPVGRSSSSAAAEVATGGVAADNRDTGAPVVSNDVDMYFPEREISSARTVKLKLKRIRADSRIAAAVCILVDMDASSFTK